MFAVLFFAQVPDVTGMVMFIALGVAAVLIVVPSVIAVQWRKQRESQMTANLLQDMLAQNLSTEEIERIMHVWSKGKMNAEELLEVTALEASREKKEKGKAGLPA